MAHARQQIRDASVTAITGLTVGGNSITVYSGMVYPIADGVLPAAVVYTPSEELDAEGESMAAAAVRALTVTIELHEKKVGDLDDRMDALCAAIEPAVVGNAPLRALLKRTPQLVATEIDMDDELEQPAAKATMTWRMLYEVSSAAPETIIA